VVMGSGELFPPRARAPFRGAGLPLVARRGDGAESQVSVRFQAGSATRLTGTVQPSTNVHQEPP
jgi:hypothetical protein